MKLEESVVQHIDSALKDWRQGDCVLGEQWFLFRLNVDFPLTKEAQDAADDGLDAGEGVTVGLLITTQTCDIVRSCKERPFVEVCPLVEVETDQFEQIKSCRRPNYAYVPGLKSQGNLVADLDRTMTVEKSVLLNWERVTGCHSDSDSRALASALARKCSRAAFPDDFNFLINKLQSRIKEKHGKESEEGRALRALKQIRVSATPGWPSETIKIFFFFIRSESESKFEGKNWSDYKDRWLKLVTTTNRYIDVDGTVTTLEDLTAREYVNSDLLDLDYLSG